jgi:quinol monooxygenase YgiN
MFMRIFRAPIQAGRIDEFAKHGQDFLDTRMQGVPGLRQMYCGSDRGSNQAVIVSIWESEQAMTDAQEHVRAFAGMVQHLLAEPPGIVSYEITAQV